MDSGVEPRSTRHFYGNFRYWMALDTSFAQHGCLEVTWLGLTLYQLLRLPCCSSSVLRGRGFNSALAFTYKSSDGAMASLSELPSSIGTKYAMLPQSVFGWCFMSLLDEDATMLTPQGESQKLSLSSQENSNSNSKHFFATRN